MAARYGSVNVDVSGPRSSNGSKPSLKNILEELDSLVDWQPLMIMLEMEQHNIKIIERNYPHDVERQKREAFDQWLRQKPAACWRDIIDALFKVKEVTMAEKVERKYDWNDPRVYVNCKYVSAFSHANLRAKPIPDDLECRKFLSKLEGRQSFYTFDVSSVQRASESLALREARYYAGQIKKKQSNASVYNLSDFLESIEKSESKKDFKIGLEARFGKMYWKLDSAMILPSSSTKKEWVSSKQLRKASFNTEVKEDDVVRLFEGKERLGKEAFTRITIEFTVIGRAEGEYSSLVHENCGMFYLDTVYRQQDIYNRARVDINLVGRKYDLRISDCSECILLEEETSVPFGIARSIADSLCTLSDKRLQLILYGAILKRESTYKIKYVRRRVHKQYKWKPEKKWILAQYDVDVFNDKPMKVMKADSAPLNEPIVVDFDYSRKEVELWGRRVYPKDVNKTHPSREKYYYFEGVDGVKLPGGEVRPPCDWTAEDLMSDFDEFLKDVFKIAYILDGAIM